MFHVKRQEKILYLFFRRFAGALGSRLALFFVGRSARGAARAGRENGAAVSTARRLSSLFLFGKLYVKL